MLSTYEYKQLIKANDRATMLNLMVGLNGYTLCSGIICEELNGDKYCAVKLTLDRTDGNRLIYQEMGCHDKHNRTEILGWKIL